MCRSIHCPSTPQIHDNLRNRDLFNFTDFDFDGLIPEVKEKNKIIVNKTRNNTKHRTSKLKLEDIPEETELHVDDIDDENPEIVLEEACNHLEMDLQVLRRSLDMGIWVLCIGVGYMVSSKLRHPPKFSSFLSSSFL